MTYFRLPGAVELPPVIDDAVPDPDEHGLRRPGLINYALAAPGIGLKAGLHHAGPPADPDERGDTDDAVVRWVSRWVAQRYPEIDPEPVASETCLYTNTADESFVLERHGRIVVGSACSGHGFQVRADPRTDACGPRPRRGRLSLSGSGSSIGPSAATIPRRRHNARRCHPSRGPRATRTDASDCSSSPSWRRWS